jgi:hypothetical protein
MYVALLSLTFALTPDATPVIASLFGIPLLCGSLERPTLSPCSEDPSNFDGVWQNGTHVQHISTCGKEKFTVVGRDAMFGTFWYVHQFVGDEAEGYKFEDFSAVFLPLCVPISARGSYTSDGLCFEMTPRASRTPWAKATRCLKKGPDHTFLHFVWGGMNRMLHKMAPS